MGVGYDRLDRVALAKRNVTVCNVPGPQLFPPNLPRQ
jgi:lactate dehydrogenase-like 2-hydroxyacid dehydrogenase